MPTRGVFELIAETGLSVAMSALSELLTNANAEGWSYEVIAEKAQARGHRLSRDTAWRYMTGRQTNVDEPYLRALADVLGLRFEEVRRAARIPANLGDWEPPAEVRALNQREREALEVIIRSMARGKSDGSTVVPLRHAEDHQVAEAALERNPGGTPPGQSEAPHAE